MTMTGIQAVLLYLLRGTVYTASQYRQYAFVPSTLYLQHLAGRYESTDYAGVT